MRFHGIRFPAAGIATIGGPHVYILKSSSVIPIPTQIAVCPNCGGTLEAVANVREQVVGNIYKVSVPTIFCTKYTKHGDSDSDEWWDIYDTVSQWMDTISVTCFDRWLDARTAVEESQLIVVSCEHANEFCCR